MKGREGEGKGRDTRTPSKKSGYGPASRTVSEINGDFGRKIAKFSNPRAFCAPAEGVSFGIG